jgi:hypothetical protein
VLAAATYTLDAIDNTTDGANGLPSIVSTITVLGNGAVIQRNPVATDSFRIFHVGANGNLSLTNLTVQNGVANVYSPWEGSTGGGIFNRGTLTLNTVTVTANTADATGGGIENYGYASDLIVILQNSLITSNRSALDGGGIYNEANSGHSLTLTLQSTTVSQNETTSNGFGGGIASRGDGGSTVTVNVINNSAVSDNTAVRGGGGIYLTGYDGSVVTISLDQSTVSGNRDGGDGGAGIYSFTDGSGTLTVDAALSTISGNQAMGNGGGIFNNGNLGITNSAVTTNTTTAGSGGGIYNESGQAILLNSTISGNRAAGDGGGIRNGAALDLTNVTIAYNTADVNATDSGDGGGLFQAATATLTNTILAKNTDPSLTNVYPDCYQTTWGGETTTSNGYNLIGNDAGCAGIFTATGDIVNADPLLGALALNPPGSTQTHALLTGSPALDQIPNTVNGCGTIILECI